MYSRAEEITLTKTIIMQYKTIVLNINNWYLRTSSGNLNASRINFVMQFIVINYKYNLLLIVWKIQTMKLYIYTVHTAYTIYKLLYNYTKVKYINQHLLANAGKQIKLN